MRPGSSRSSAADARPGDGGAPRVWRFDLDSPSLPALGDGWLDREERRRADRRPEPRARRARAARIALRGILAAEVGAAPGALHFTTGARGKPSLADASSALDFNLSHTGPFGLLALARPGPVGVDVEEERLGRPFAGLARRCFTPAELREWSALSEDARTHGFYALWSCKEAVAKALGRGLSLPLRSIRIDAGAAFAGRHGDEIGVDWAALADALGGGAEGRALDGGPWRLARLDAGPGRAAALCWLGPAAPDLSLPRVWPAQDEHSTPAASRS